MNVFSTLVKQYVTNFTNFVSFSINLEHHKNGSKWNE